MNSPFLSQSLDGGKLDHQCLEWQVSKRKVTKVLSG